MKVSITLDPAMAEDHIHITTKSMTPDLQKIVTEIQEDTPYLSVKTEDNAIYFVDTTDIIAIYTEQQKLKIITVIRTFTMVERLYKIKVKLPASFIQISESELINLNYLNHIEITSSGSLKLIFKHDYLTYSSRRYVKSIKERLGL
ncbi:LytTR family DNA-binding domain-containing protein [Staphylococcus coagulans]|uniref:LytTR family transcriptional regulator n=1 Tax=Staphylococcus coagulans TaxID=74706 RepID=A0A9X0PGP5_9STAP|nr:LytTR family DNA-binding domain-containing protein [Staphylococcus coagulans]MBA8771937.1 LytTR family transcriptional regulator [Staphylococcus coagulans]MBA8776328.1 LytTR family transcriptional regulator [Staphylococcus coagulans]